jgi:hypothetical protein
LTTTPRGWPETQGNGPSVSATRSSWHVERNSGKESLIWHEYPFRHGAGGPHCACCGGVAHIGSLSGNRLVALYFDLFGHAISRDCASPGLLERNTYFPSPGSQPPGVPPLRGTFSFASENPSRTTNKHSSHCPASVSDPRACRFSPGHEARRIECIVWGLPGVRLDSHGNRSTTNPDKNRAGISTM